MKSVILAAGIGSRLRPVTIHQPKSTITVDGTPILEHQLRAYAEAGIEETHVIAGYMASQVRTLCGRVAAEYPDFEITVLENEAFANTDNMYSLYCVRSAVGGEEFILSNGDVVFDPEIVDRLAAAGDSSFIACDTSQYDEEAMKVTTDSRGRIDHISKDVDGDEAYATSIDLYRFSPEFSEQLFQRIERTVEVEREFKGWTEVAIDGLLGRGTHDVRPFDIAGAKWVEIDDHHDLLCADRTFSSMSDLSEKEAVFFDLDGTLYLDDELVEGADDVVAALRVRGVDVYFLSNNSSRWKTDYAERLSEFGIEATPEDIILSTDGVIDYLRQGGVDDTYVVGTEAMRGAIRGHGIEVEADEPEAVVVGFDTELTYEKVRRASLAIQNGATFLLAHADLVCPTTEGPIPDCGSIGALVETATGRAPARVFGKPNPEMIAHVLEREDLSPEDIAIVGDRLETEMRMAERLGCESACVLTGDTDRLAIEQSELTPSMVVRSVGDLSPNAPDAVRHADDLPSPRPSGGE